MSAKVYYVPFSPEDHLVIAQTIAMHGIEKAKEKFGDAFEPSVLDAVFRAVIKKYWGKK